MIRQRACFPRMGAPGRRGGRHIRGGLVSQRQGQGHRGYHVGQQDLHWDSGRSNPKHRYQDDERLSAIGWQDEKNRFLEIVVNGAPFLERHIESNKIVVRKHNFGSLFGRLGTLMPIAIPTSARLSAGASFMPSPVMATSRCWPATPAPAADLCWLVRAKMLNAGRSGVIPRRSRLDSHTSDSSVGFSVIPISRPIASRYPECHRLIILTRIPPAYTTTIRCLRTRKIKRYQPAQKLPSPYRDLLS